jgi:hypothetical protein
LARDPIGKPKAARVYAPCRFAHVKLAEEQVRCRLMRTKLARQRTAKGETRHRLRSPTVCYKMATVRQKYSRAIDGLNF